MFSPPPGNQTDRQYDRLTGRWSEGWWEMSSSDWHPALFEPHVTVVPSQPGRKAPLLSLQAASSQKLQFSSSWTGLWTQTLWPSARGVLGPMSKQLTAKQCALKGLGLFMESFKVTAPWAPCSLTTHVHWSEEGWCLANAGEHGAALC